MLPWTVILLGTTSFAPLGFAAEVPSQDAPAAPVAPVAPAALAAAPAPPVAPVPAAPSVKWRGALWASGAESNQQTADGSLFLRSMDAGNGQLAVDGLQLGADVALPDGWALKFTLLAGQDGKILNAGTVGSNGLPVETGSIAWPEAQLSWTGGAETVKIGRMYTPMGMEVMDDTQNITASRGLLFTYAVPIAQVGVNWHHAFTPSWSADLWVYNGEDKLQDNNTGKTGGLGVTYNHGGATDKFVTLMAFSGPEQTSLGSGAVPGAEGRKRNRLSLAGQWTWGNSTLQFEGESATETFPGGTAATPQGTFKASWSGAGIIYKYQFNDFWSLFLRAETLKDDTGVRLSGDTNIAKAYPSGPNQNLQATSFALGAERRWHATFSRLEARLDSLNKSVAEAPAAGTSSFKSAASLTWSVGTSF